jgi:hypothetical protein
MPSPVSLREARAVLGDDLLGPEEVAAILDGAAPEPPVLPFPRQALTAAAAAGEMLVLRVAAVPDGPPLTMLHFIESFPEAFDQKFLRQMGYQLKDDWGIALEPLAAQQTCTAGWALVRKAILDDSRNLAYDAQDDVVRRYAADHGLAAGIPRRRSAVEAVYDTLLYFRTRGVRLLEKTWDWSASLTVDGGYLNIGGFGTNGLQILSYSRACRHGALGVCPTRGGTAA